MEVFPDVDALRFRYRTIGDFQFSVYPQKLASWPPFTCSRTCEAWYNQPLDLAREGEVARVEPGSDFDRWQHAVAAKSIVKDGFSNPDFAEEPHLPQMVSEPDALRYEPYSPQNYPGYGQSLWRSLSGLLTSLVYGLLHLYGWNAQFASNAERVWWRLATVMILIFGVGGPLLGYYILLARVQGKEGRRVRYAKFLDLLGVVIYCVCALSLVIESFHQLVYLPDNAFELPSLSIYWPHFS